MTSHRPSAFISYAWEPDHHKAWVKEFSARLRREGVEVTLDQWHAVPGDQLSAFMERSVRTNDFVVIVCTPEYKTKSDGRTGGVGYEGDVMTAEVMTSQNHRKFIPILRIGSWRDAAPSWLLGKYYVDLRGDAYSESNYADLLSTLLGRREVPPPVGDGPVMAAVTTRPSVAAPDFAFQIALAEQLSYESDRNQGYQRIARLALEHGNVDVTLQVIGKLTYASDRDRWLKDTFEHCLKRADVMAAAKVLEGFQYPSDRDAARKRLLERGSP